MSIYTRNFQKKRHGWLSYQITFSFVLEKVRYINSDCAHKHSEVDIKKNAWVFRNQFFQESVRIPMGTNCSPLLADLLLYSNEAEFFVFKTLYLKKINNSLWLSTQLSGIVTTYYHYTIVTSILKSARHIPVNLK